MNEPINQKAAELLRDDLGNAARLANLDALIANPHALQALRLTMRLEPAADQLVAKIDAAPARRRWFAWLDGWNLGGLAAASAAAALMLLAPAPTQQNPQVSPAAPQQLLAGDIVSAASFEPTGELFGGDFES